MVDAPLTKAAAWMMGSVISFSLIAIAARNVEAVGYDAGMQAFRDVPVGLTEELAAEEDGRCRPIARYFVLRRNASFRYRRVKMTN